jgi:hypothetical protein
MRCPATHRTSYPTPWRCRITLQANYTNYSFRYLRFVRRFISITLLLLILANFAGAYFYFAFRAWQIKKEMRVVLTSLPDDKLQVLILKNEEFHLARVNEHELKIQGKMFDMARIRIADDRVLVYGVYDEAEDNLLVFIETVLQNLQQDAAGAPGVIAHFCTLPFLLVADSYDFSVCLPDREHRSLYVIHFSSFAPSVDGPPPWLV